MRSSSESRFRAVITSNVRPGTSLAKQRRVEQSNRYPSVTMQLEKRSGLTPTLSPGRGRAIWPRRGAPPFGERRLIHEIFSHSLRERAGVRASFLSDCIVTAKLSLRLRDQSRWRWERQVSNVERRIISSPHGLHRFLGRKILR